MSRHDATPDHIATGLVIVVPDVTVGIVISRAPVTEAKSAATEATTAEATPAMETATTMAATAAAMATTTMGKGSGAGCAEQDYRCADDTEATHREQSYGRQTARQDVAVARVVLSHRYSFPDLCTHRKIYKNDRR
jgi:hypothetical protein